MKLFTKKTIVLCIRTAKSQLPKTCVNRLCARWTRLNFAREPLRAQNVLDIGASSGLLLDTFRQEFGAGVTGIEPGNAYRAAAEKRDIQMFSSLENLLETNHNTFDLITMMHVLEHLPSQSKLCVRFVSHF